MAKFEHLGGEKRKEKTEKEDYIECYLSCVATEKWNGAKWATFTSSRKLKKDCEAGVETDQEILE